MPEIKQLELKDLDITFDLEVGSESGVFISPQEQQLISETARQVFEKDPKKIVWFNTYITLAGLGWDWRMAAYIAWRASPSRGRYPKTQLLLAIEILGLKSDRVINTWRKRHPAIEKVISLLSVQELFDSRADRINALVDSASDPDYKHHSDRKTSFIMDGSLIPRAKIEVERVKTDPLNLTDNELQKIIDGDKEDQGEKK